MLDWDDVIDRTALGFDQVKPPGLAEVAALDERGAPIAAADAAANRARTISLPCGSGPIIGVAGQFVQTSVTTTVGDCSTASPIPARPCRSRADHAARRPAGAGDQPRPGVHRRRRRSSPPRWPTESVTAHNAFRRSPSTVDKRSPRGRRDRRRTTERMLVVPESINPGWIAHTADGATLTPSPSTAGSRAGCCPRAPPAPSRSTSPPTRPTGSGCSAGWRCCRCCSRSRSCRCAGPAIARTGRRPTVAARPRRSCGGAVVAVAVIVVGVGGVAGRRRRDRRPVSAAPTRESAGDATDGRHRGVRADPGRCGAQPEPVALGRRLRRPLGGRAVARAALGRRRGGVGGPVRRSGIADAARMADMTSARRPPIGTQVSALAAHAPDAPAVTCDGVTVTRAELDATTNRLARAFASLGVGRRRLRDDRAARTRSTGCTRCWRAGSSARCRSRCPRGCPTPSWPRCSSCAGRRCSSAGPTRPA